MAELVDALVSGTSGSNALEVQILLSAPVSGVVAQLIERYVRIVEVVGLSPISSTKTKCPVGGHFLCHVPQNFIDKCAPCALVYWAGLHKSDGDMAEW